MGCGASRIEEEALNFVSKRYPKLLAFLDLGPFGLQLAKFFEKSGREGVGSRVKVTDFLELLALNQTRAAQRLFAMCDFEGLDSLDFREMLFTVWHLATLDDRGLVQTVFSLYDADSDGILQVEDCVDLITDCYGKGIAADVHVKKLIASLKSQGAMSKPAFWEFTKRSPMTLMQIVDMQSRVRKNLLGESVWKRLEAKRSAKMDQAFQPLNYAELYAKVVVLDVQSGGKSEAKKTGYEEDEEEVVAAAAERPATPEDNGPGDIVIERSANSRAAGADLALSGSGAKNHDASAGGGRRIRGFKGERLGMDVDKAVTAAAAAAAAIAAAAPVAKSAEEVAREARLEEATELATAELAEHHGVDVEGGAAAKSPRPRKKGAKVGVVPPPPPKEEEPAASGGGGRGGGGGGEEPEHHENDGDGGGAGDGGDGGVGAGAMPVSSGGPKKGKGASSTKRQKTVYKSNAKPGT